MQETGSADLLVASANSGKVAEIQRLLEPHSIRIIGLADLPAPPELQEPYETFEENACAKATQGAQHVGIPALADDSGLVVDVLQGRPGVRSSRYADTDAERIQRLLEELAGLAPAERGARFVCVVALAGPAGIMGVWEGVVEGRIAT
ncbi:MAG: non-canonical purine NTP pyrophosphatase, partial [Armatimonadota bacterium]